jgi:hypothetical protein
VDRRKTDETRMVLVSNTRGGQDTIHGEREELGGHMKVVWSDGRSKRVIDMAGEWQGPHEPR